MFGHLLFIMVVTVKWTHKPIVFEECFPLTFLVNISHDHFSLKQHFLFLYCSYMIATLTLFSCI